MTIKLIACDLDGTLFGPDLTFSSRLRQATQRAQAQGITITIATGRGFPTAARFAQCLGLSAPLICYQGAQIKTQDGILLYESTLSRQHLPSVVRFCQEGGWELAVYYDDQIYQTTTMYDLAFYDRWFSLPVHRVDDLITALPGNPLKFIITAPTKKAGDQLERRVRVLSNGAFQVMRSHAWFVEGLAPDVSKGNSVARLAAYLGIAREAVMAIGDSGNDVSMVEWAGVGVAVDNASPDVKSAANVLAPAQQQDGAAWAIERYALGEST
jgi:Cof subfamily protein (haloacid dehalogenase superfamily)